MTSVAASAPVQPNSQRLTRSTVALFLMANLIAILGPFYSFHEDLDAVRRLTDDLLIARGTLTSQILYRQIEILETELRRVAARREIDFTDKSADPEHLLFELAHHGSALFTGGIALFDANGAVVSSEPAGLSFTRFEVPRWLPRILAGQRAVVLVVSIPSAPVLVVVPVRAGDRIVGAVAGLAAPIEELETQEVLGDKLEAALVDVDGRMFTGPAVDSWIVDLARKDATGAERSGPVRRGSGGQMVIAPVRATGLKIALAIHDSVVMAPMKGRFITQMLILVSAQVGAVVLLSLTLSRVYQSYAKTERAEAERERLVALGTAASLIAHEVKNSLSGLKAASSLLNRGVDPALPVKSIRGEVDRLAHLASSLLYFGRTPAARLQTTDVQELVREVVAGMEALPGSDEVDLVCEMPDALRGQADPLLLATVLHNLVRNAVEAAVVAKDTGLRVKPRVVVHVERQAKSARIVVTDDAGGLSPEVAPHLFEPFVTGKSKGIGLGLTMAKRAAEVQGFALRYEAVPGGSRFWIDMPIAEVV